MMDADYLLEIGFNLIDVSLIAYFTWRVLKINKINLYISIPLILLQTFINMFINIKYGIASLPGLFIMIVTTGIIFKIIFKEKMINIYMCIIVGLILMFVCELICSAILLITINSSTAVFFTNTIYRMVGAIISKILSLLVIVKITDKIKFSTCFDKSQTYRMFLLCIFNIIIVFAAFLFYKYTYIFKGTEKTYIFSIIVCVMILTILIANIIQRMIEYSQKEIEWNIREEEYKKQLFYTKNIEDMLSSIKAERHDFRHHVNCLYGLINLNKTEDAKNYIENLTEEVIQFDEMININHPILASLINIKLMKAKRENIKVDINIDLPDKVNVDPLDLSIIIGNLMDNAIEACMDSKTKNKFINLCLYIKRHHLIIKLVNSKCSEIIIKPEMVGENFTSKQDVENHGYGLSNIDHVIKKYNGILKIEDNVDSFKIHIALSF